MRAAPASRPVAGVSLASADVGRISPAVGVRLTSERTARWRPFKPSRCSGRSSKVSSSVHSAGRTVIPARINPGKGPLPRPPPRLTLGEVFDFVLGTSSDCGNVCPVSSEIQDDTCPARHDSPDPIFSPDSFPLLNSNSNVVEPVRPRSFTRDRLGVCSRIRSSNTCEIRNEGVHTLRRSCPAAVMRQMKENAPWFGDRLAVVVMLGQMVVQTAPKFIALFVVGDKRKIVDGVFGVAVADGLVGALSRCPTEVLSEMCLSQENFVSLRKPRKSVWLTRSAITWLMTRMNIIIIKDDHQAHQNHQHL